MVFHLSISSYLGNMVQLSLYNATNFMNGNILQMISLRFLLIVSVAESDDVLEVHVLAEAPELDCYISVLVFLSTLM